MAKADEAHKKVEKLEDKVEDARKEELHAQADDKRQEARELDKKARD